MVSLLLEVQFFIVCIDGSWIAGLVEMDDDRVGMEARSASGRQRQGGSGERADRVGLGTPLHMGGTMSPAMAETHNIKTP